MAGKITVSTLNNDTGVLATQNGMTGIAKAWVNFNGSGGAVIRGSFNVSSVTRSATGTYTVNFTTSLADTNYCAQVTAGTSSNNWWAVRIDGAYSTTSLNTIKTVNSSGVDTDSSSVNVAIFGS